MIQKSYNENNQLSDAFEYHCDGIPPYKYYYSNNNDGTETEECFLAVTGDIYSITKRKKDNRGNIIEESKNFPGDTYDRTSLKIEYKYDDKGNCIERRFMAEAPVRYLNKYSKRRIHYLDE